MAGAPIDTAYVDIKPDFSSFDRDAMRGVDSAAHEIKSTMEQLVTSVEEIFNAMARDVSQQFDEINRNGDEAFSRLANAAEDSAHIMADDFQRNGEIAERALKELSARANTEFGKVDRDAQHVGKSMGGGMGFLGSTLLLGGVTAVAGGLSQLTKFGLTSAATLEQTKVAFSSLTGSMAAGQAQFDALQKFAAATPFEFQDLTVGAGRFDAFAKSVGMSQDQLVPFLTTIGNVISETGGGAQALDSVTLALGQIASRGKVTLDNINQLSNAMPGFSGVSAIAAATGKTQAQVMDEISSGSLDASTGIAALLKGMQQFPGAADAMQKQSLTLMGVWSTFHDTMSMALSGAFTPVIPAIKDALTQVTPIIGQALSVLGPAIGSLLASALPLIGSLVQAIVPILAPILDALGKGLTAIGPALQPLGAALGLIASALAPILPMAGDLIAALASGLTPVIAALAPVITGLVAALGPLIGPISALLVEVGGTLAQIILPVATALGTIFGALAKPLGDVVYALGSALTPIMAALGPVMVQLVNALMPLLPAILQLAPPTVQIVVALTPLIALTAQLLSLAVAIAAPLIKLAANLLSLGIIKVIVPMVTGLAGALGWLTHWLEPVVGWLAQFTKWIGGLNWGSIGHAIAGGFTQGWNAVVTFITGIPGAIGGFLSALPGQLRGLAISAMVGMFDAITTGIGWIIGEFFALPGQIWAILTSLWIEGARLITSFVQDSAARLMALPGRITSIISDAWRQAGVLFGQGVAAVVAFATTLPGRVASGVSNLWSSIKGAIGDLFSKGGEIGHDLLMGLIHGIEGAVDAAVSAAKRAVGNVVKGAKNALGISSPSKVFVEIGKNTVAGYTKGIDDHAGSAASAISSLVTPPQMAGTGASGGSAMGGIVFGSGAIVISVNGSVSAAQASMIGQQVGQGIIDKLNDPAYELSRKPRTT